MSEELDARRRELLDLNTRAWDGEDVFKTSSKLDSSLKKNTTFIKKIRTISSDQYQNILKDITTVSLEKYLSEIILSISAGLLKISKGDDILAAIEIVSALHQRFSTSFTPYLFANFLNGLASPIRQPVNEQEKEKEDQLRIARQKNLIKLLMEFYLIGIFRTVKDCDRENLPDFIIKKYSKAQNEPIVILVLKDILNFEIKLGNSLPISQVFLKRFSHVVYDNENCLLSFETRNILQQIFKIYTLAILEILVQLNTKLGKLAERNKKASIRTGKILEENITDINHVTSLFDKFRNASEFLCGILNMDVPELPNNQPEEEESVVTGLVKNKSLNEDDLEIWDNIKERNFYTKIPDISDLTSDKPETISEISSGEKINEFITKLEKVSNEQEIDALVSEFINLELNNKATRNRIMKFFIETPNINNLRFYSRFLKINESSLKTLIDELITYLDKGFRSQIYNNKLNFKNIFFFCELIKFKLIPTHVIFHKIRSLTVNISSTNNIDILSVFYEQCGRFLLNDPDYKALMNEMIELLKQKLKNDKLTANDKLAINNLLIVVIPPTTKINQLHNEKPKLTPQQQFIIRLSRYELNSKTFTLVMRSLKKFDYVNDEELQTALLDVFASPDLLNYENIVELSKLLEQLSKKYKSLLIKTVDTIVEKIMRGLELNDYRLNRTRISHVKFISELYNLKLLNFKFIIDLLYKILCLGHPNNQPLPNNYDIEIDLPNNYFRIQLCCMLLNNLNSIVKSTSTKKSSKLKSIKRKNEVNEDLLTIFLTFFQFYCFCKQQPIPIEIEFQLNDLFTKYYPNLQMERFRDLTESIHKLQEIIQQKGFQQSEEYDDYEDEDDDDDEEVDDDDDDDDDDELDEDDDSDDDSENEEDDDEDEDADDDDEEDDEEDEEIERVAQFSEEDKKFADDLDKEFQKIVLDSYEYNKANASSRNKFNVPLPPKINASQGSNENKISFSLLTKQGKRNNVKQVNLPTDTKFAESLLKEQANQKTHRERIMNLVLNMDN
jgi:regulator of nonsense transcripts 2